MANIAMRLVLLLGFLLFVSTYASAKEPEEIWGELGKLSGLKDKSSFYQGPRRRARPFCTATSTQNSWRNSGSISISAIRQAGSLSGIG